MFIATTLRNPGVSMRHFLWLLWQVALTAGHNGSAVIVCELDASDQYWGPCHERKRAIVPNASNPFHFWTELHAAFEQRTLLLGSGWRTKSLTPGVEVGHFSYNLLAYGLSSLAIGRQTNPTDLSFWLEFGVFRGRSINITRAILNESFRVVGFDTFQGLPEQWGGFKKGSFDIGGVGPPTLPNIQLRKGLIKDGLSEWVLTHPHVDLAGVNIDCDLYRGALQALFLLHGYFRPGTLIHFHEIFPRKGTRPTDEGRALETYLRACPGTVFELLPIRTNFAQPAIFIVRKVRDGPCRFVPATVAEDFGWRDVEALLSDSAKIS